MRLMVVETYLHGPEPVYRRLGEGGRRIPDGIRFLDSWVDAALGRCWQLMEAPDVESLAPWIEAWSDLVAFEVVEVLTSQEAAARASGPP